MSLRVRVESESEVMMRQDCWPTRQIKEDYGAGVWSCSYATVSTTRLVSGRIEDQRKGVRRGGASMRRSDTHNRDGVVSRVTATISSSSQHNKLKHPEMSLNSDDMCVVHLCAFILTVSRAYDCGFVWKGTWALPETFSAIVGCLLRRLEDNSLVA